MIPHSINANTTQKLVIQKMRIPNETTRMGSKTWIIRSYTIWGIFIPNNPPIKVIPNPIAPTNAASVVSATMINYNPPPLLQLPPKPKLSRVNININKAIPRITLIYFAMVY